MRELLVTSGFATKLSNDAYELKSPVNGHTAVAVLYAIMVEGIYSGKIDKRLVAADCACVAGNA